MSLPACPKCQCEYIYEDQQLLICPECAYEWNPNNTSDEDAILVKDANGGKPNKTSTLILQAKLFF